LVKNGWTLLLIIPFISFMCSRFTFICDQQFK